jgi:hypothetical protein
VRPVGYYGTELYLLRLGFLDGAEGK